MMDARGGDVFQVEMADVRRQPVHRRGRVVADAVGVADVEVQADGRRVDVLHQFQELVGRLDEQARLRLDQQQHALLLGMLDRPA